MLRQTSKCMKNILVPFDGSGFSQKAFEKALEIAEKFSSQIIVLTVLQSKVSDSAEISLKRLQEIQEEEENEALAILKKLEDQASAKNISLSMKIIHNPSSSDGIVAFAANNNIDLIIMGSQGKTGLKKIVLGSVASGVLAHTKCSVLITKGTE